MNVGAKSKNTPKVEQMPTASIMRDVAKLDKIYPPREVIMRNDMVRLKALGLTLVYKDVPFDDPKITKRQAKVMEGVS